MGRLAQTLGLRTDTMPHPGASTLLEKITGSLPVQGSFAVVAALSGGPLAALLPVLATTLASQRQAKRIEAAISQIQDALRGQEEYLEQMSDAQYKLINEAVLTILHTTDDNKIALLKVVVRNSPTVANISDFEATALSRLLRDLSAEECHFILDNFQRERIGLVVEETKVSNRAAEHRIDSREGAVVAGLASLGVLVAAGGTYEDLGTFRFMPITAKLIALLRTEA